MQPQQNALFVVGMPALELNYVIKLAYLILTHRTVVVSKPTLAVVKQLNFLLGESLADLSYLLAQFDQLLGRAFITS